MASGPSHAVDHLPSRDSTTDNELSNSFSKTSQDGLDHQNTHDTTRPLTDGHHLEQLPPPQEYRRYKRRFIGLAQLILLNIIVSWDWLTFASVSNTAAPYFGVSEADINWLSTAFLLAFPVAAPFTIYILNKFGVKASILAASVLTLAGNWIRYGGTRAGAQGSYGLVMFGQILIGLAQPFVLASPTRYSQMWFSDTGRITATAFPSLANPLGALLGQAISPLFSDTVSGIPSVILYTAIISSVATIPSIFIPSKPPTPPSATAALEKLDLRHAMHELPRNASFFLIAVPFAVYVGFFNAFSTLIAQIFGPWGFSDIDSGLTGVLLIAVGLVTSAVISPIIDRTKAYLLAVKLIVPAIAILYIVLIFMPQTQNVVGPWVVCALLGSTSFTLLPVALDLLTIITLPVSPEVSSVIAWSGGQLLGALFVIIMQQLTGGISGQPPDVLTRGLIFQAVIACAAVPPAMLLGVWRFRRIVLNPEGYMEAQKRSNIEWTQVPGSESPLYELDEMESTSISGE